MKILVDIKHPAQLNLFKHLANELQQDGWQVTISYLRRGKLPRIIDKEYAQFENRLGIGASNGSRWSILWDGNIRRFFDFFRLMVFNRYNIAISASSIPLAVAGSVSGTPVIQFYDDPERKRINSLNAFFSSKIFFPPVVQQSKKVGVFNCLKEWSYLSPARFQPCKDVLQEYDLRENEYVFIREVSNKSFNYFDQEAAIVGSFAAKIKKGTKVILSLEDKSMALKYPADWIILKEPVSDIHSLMYYSKLVVSSGDSIAREGAMLGIPSIYCGIREMKANDLLMKKGLLQHLPSQSALPMINEVIAKPFDHGWQSGIREELKSEWDDMVKFMKDQIVHYMKGQKGFTKPSLAPVA